METVDFISEIVVFKPSKGSDEFEIILDGEHDTVWVTEQQLVELFGKARRTIGEHIRNIYKEGELEKESTWRKFRQVQKEGERKVKRAVSAYNLDVVISVGYRVKSPVGIEFRKERPESCSEARKMIHSGEYWEVYPKRCLENWHIQPLKSRQHNCYILSSKDMLLAMEIRG